MHARVVAKRGGAADRHVVLVHGLAVSSAYYIPLLERLGDHCVAWAPDLPGHGLTPAPGHALDFDELSRALESWLDATQLAGVTLVGNSLGAQLSADVARRRPDLVDSLVLLGSTTEQSAKSIPRHAMRLAQDATREPLRLLGLLVLEYLRSGPRRVLQEFTGARDRDLRIDLRLLSQPVTLVRGGRDPISTETWQDALHEAMPGAKRATLQVAAHAAHWSHPGAISALVRSGTSR